MGDSRVYLGLGRESIERQMLAILLTKVSIFCMKKSTERVAGSRVGFERGVIEN